MGIFTNAITSDFSLGHQMVLILSSGIPLQYSINTNQVVFITHVLMHTFFICVKVCVH